MMLISFRSRSMRRHVKSFHAFFKTFGCGSVAPYHVFICRKFTKHVLPQSNRQTKASAKTSEIKSYYQNIYRKQSMMIRASISVHWLNTF
ncbi:unnamed protein product [Brassica oleracea var. botrytis]